MEKELQIVKKTPLHPHRTLSKNQTSLLCDKLEVRWHLAQASPRPTALLSTCPHSSSLINGASPPLGVLDDRNKQHLSHQGHLTEAARAGLSPPPHPVASLGIPSCPCHTQPCWTPPPITMVTSVRQIIPPSHLEMPDLLCPELVPPFLPRTNFFLPFHQGRDSSICSHSCIS